MTKAMRGHRFDSPLLMRNGYTTRGHLAGSRRLGGLHAKQLQALAVSG